MSATPVQSKQITAIQLMMAQVGRRSLYDACKRAGLDGHPTTALDAAKVIRFLKEEGAEVPVLVG